MDRADSLGSTAESSGSRSESRGLGRTDDDPIIGDEALGSLQIVVPQLRDESFDDDQSMGSNDEPAGSSLRDEGSKYSGTSRIEVCPLDVALSALVKIEVEEFNVFGPPGGESREKAKRAKDERPRGPIPESASLMGDRDLDGLRLEFSIPDEVEFVAPSISDRVEEPPEGYFSLYRDFFRNTYLQFPIPGLFVRYLHRFGLSFSQLLPRSMRHLVGLFVRSRECGVELSTIHLENFLEVRSSNKERRNYTLSSRANRPIFSNIPNKDKRWWRYYFFVRIDEASVESGCEHLVRRGHGLVARRPFSDIPSDLDEVYDRLRERKTNWKRHFHLERVRRAFSLENPGDCLSSDTSTYSPRTLEPEMSRKITFREQLLQDARRSSHLQTSQIDGLVTRVIEGPPVEPVEEAPVQTPREIVLASPAVRPSGSQLRVHGENSKKRRAGRAEEEKESRTKKKKKASRGAVETPAEPTSVRVAGVEASGRWFSRISCGTGQFPRLDEMNRRQEYESCAVAGVQYIAQMNRMVAAYEADLKDAAESRELFEQSIANYAGIEASLQDRVAGLEKEKRDAVGRAEVYERKYDEQYAELLALRDQVKAMREAESRVEAEARRKVLVELEEASAARRSEFRRLVGDLRGDVTTRMLHYGQAENNLSLVKDLLSDQPPDLEGEKSLLEGGMVALAGASEAFDKVVDDLERLVSEPGVPLLLAEPVTGHSSSQGAKTADEAEVTDRASEEVDGANGTAAGVEADEATLEVGDKEGDVAEEKDDAEVSKAVGEGSQNTEEI